MSAQAFATEVHTAFTLQVHEADPAVPVQLCRTPEHATGVPYAQQPLLPIVQVARLPDTHVVCPCEQLLEHVSEHAALGDVPEHDCGFGHVVVEFTYGQPWPSTMHVASVCPFSHVVPASVQIDETHVHAEALAAPVHVWCVPQLVDVVHCVHPLECIVHVWTALPSDAHCTRFSVQPFVQGLPSPLASDCTVPSVLVPESVSVASRPASAPGSIPEELDPLLELEPLLDELVLPEPEPLDVVASLPALLEPELLPLPSALLPPESCPPPTAKFPLTA